MKAVEGWIDIKIRDFFSSSMPGDWGTDGNPEDCIPVLRSTNFRNNGLIDYSDIAYRKVEEARLNKRRIGKGTILIEKSGGSPSQAAGRVVYCDCEFNGTASNFIEVIKVKDDFSSRYVAFLLYYLYQIGIVLKYQQQTTGIINFKLNEYSEEMVNCPASKPEQTKIAEILSTVDRAIEQTEALITKQQRIKTGLMQDLLTRGIDDHGNLRSEQTHEFKDSPLGRIPVEWEAAELETVAEFVTSGSRGWAQYYSSEGARFLRIGNLTRDHINLRLEDMAFVNPPRTSEGKRTSVLPCDLIISITADLGIIGVIPEGFGEGYVNQHIALVRLSPTKGNARFIGWFLSGRGGRSQFEKLNESGAKAGLNLPTIRKLFVPITKPREEARIAEIIDTNSNRVSDLYSRLGKLRSLKTALMQDLLTGKKRVAHLLEPAEKPAA